VGQEKKQKTTRAGFVRGLPLEVPVDEVIRRGKAAGLEIKKGDVYAARHYMKNGDRASAPTLSVASGNGAIRVNNRPSRIVHVQEPGAAANGTEARRDAFRALSLEKQFKLFVKRVGTVRAHAWVDEVESEVLD
jgi:hypothetical protein